MLLVDARLALGLDVCKKISRPLVEDSDWSRLGVFVFKDEDIVKTNKMLVPPEVFLLSICLSAREVGLKPILVLGARKRSSLDVAGQEGLSSLSHMLGGEARPLYLGVGEESPLSSLQRAKISLSWLMVSPGILAETIKAASPVKRDVKEVDLTDIPALSRLLIEKLGPPSFKEDLVARVKGADKIEVAGDVLYAMAAVISPPSMIATGLKYAAKLVRLIRERRREEYRALLEAWKKNVEEGFSEEKVGRLVGEDGLAPIKASLEEGGTAVIIHDLIGTLHELFFPLFIANLVDELGGEGLLLIIDNASHLARFGWPVDMLSSAPDEHEGLRLACYIHTADIPDYAKLPDMMKAFFSERAALFDLSPRAIEAVCEGKSAAFRASLLRLLEEAARERLAGNLAFVLYDVVRAPMPELVKIRPGLFSRLKARFKVSKMGGLRLRRPGAGGEAEESSNSA